MATLPKNITIVEDRDIFTSECQTIVRSSTCNGSLPDDGFKLNFPDMIKAYTKACDNHELAIGKMWIYRELPSVKNRKTLVCFPIRDSRSDTTSIPILERGLKDLLKNYKELRIKSIAIPLLARKGISRHSEEAMLNLMIEYLKRIDINVEIYL